MGRFAALMFQSFMTGAIEGIADGVITPSRQDKKTSSVAKDTLSNQKAILPATSCSPVMPRSDGLMHGAVGIRGIPPQRLSNPERMINLPVNPIPVVQEFDNRTREAVGVRQATISKASNPAITESERAPASKPTTLQTINSNDTVPKQAVIADIPHMPIESKPVFVATPVIVKEVPPLPSVGVMYDKIKHAFMDARTETKIEKHGDRVHLHEIAESARCVVLVRIGAATPNAVTIQYRRTVELAEQKIEALIHEIAPHVNAHVATEVILLEAGTSGKSNVCIQRAAEAALLNIAKQSQGMRAVLNEHENIVYSPLQVHNAHVDNRPGWSASSDHDHDHVDPNPYSPLGPPSSQQSSIVQSSNSLNDSLIVQNDSVKADTATWVEGTAQFLKDVDARMYAEVNSYGFSAGFDVSVGDVVLKGVEIMRDLPSVVPPDFASNPNIDCSGPIYPTYNTPDTTSDNAANFTTNPHMDYSGPIYPSFADSDAKDLTRL